MDNQERQRLQHIVATISSSPEIGYMMAKPPAGMIGVNEIGNYLGELAIKIGLNGTPEQWNKLSKLCRAHKGIVQDLNESYMLYLMYCEARRKNSAQAHEIGILKAEISELHKELDKLQKTLNFDK